MYHLHLMLSCLFPSFSFFFFVRSLSSLYVVCVVYGSWFVNFWLPFLLQRLMLQPAALATKVLSLTQVVNEDELKDDEDYEDILEDMRTECGKFGKYYEWLVLHPWKCFAYFTLLPANLLLHVLIYFFVTSFCFTAYCSPTFCYTKSGLTDRRSHNLLPVFIWMLFCLFWEIVSILSAFAGTLVNVVIPRPKPNGEPTPGVGKVSMSFLIP